MENKGKHRKHMRRCLGMLLAGVLTVEASLGTVLGSAQGSEYLDVQQENAEDITVYQDEGVQDDVSTGDVLQVDSDGTEYDSIEGNTAAEEDDTESLTMTIIDETSFPDENLRQLILEQVDTDKDTYLSQEEIDAVVSLDIRGRDICDLKGMELFTQLRELDCSWNHLDRGDVEPYLQLEKLTYYNNTYLAATEEEVVEDRKDLEDWEIPGATETPEATEIPGATETPEATETPGATEKPGATETPEATETPGEVETPGAIEIPEATETLEASETPEAAEIQEVAENLETSEASNATDNSNGIKAQGTARMSGTTETSAITANPMETDIADGNETTGPTATPEITPTSTPTETPEEINMPSNEEKPWKFTFISVISSDDFADITIDETVFPDEVFRKLLSERYDLDANGILEISEQQRITSLYVRECGIQDLTGIGNFKNLLLLDCSVNQLQQLEVKELKELRGLYCRENQIQQLDLTENILLKQLECDDFVQVKGFGQDNVGAAQTPAVTAKTATAISVGKTSIRSMKNSKKAVLAVTYKKVSGAKGYDVQIARSKNFRSGLVRKYTTKTSHNFTKLYKNYTYYVRVRAYKYDSQKKRVFGKFSAVKKITIKNGRVAVSPSARATTLKSVSLTSKSNIRVRVYAPNYVKSSDGYYYLFSLTATEGTMAASRKPIAKAAKRTNTYFNVALKYNTSGDRLQRKFAVGVKVGNKYTLVSGRKFISNPEKLAISNRAFPKSSTKKGLQVNEYYIDDAVSLGVKHTTYNMCLDDMIATDSEKNSSQGIAFNFDGKTYWFDRGIIESYDRTLNTYKQNNMIVSAIILLRYRSDLTYLMPTGYYQQGFYALKTTTEAARKQLAATFTFLARRYATDGRIANWIIGNEVNNYGNYHYTGSSKLSKNAKIYADSFRLAYIAIRSVYSKARLYISLDHLWNTITNIQHGSRAFLNKFASYLDGYGNFNIAYHAYPSPLTAPEFWANSNNTITNSYKSPCITMGNIKVLTNYVKKKFGSGTRIILSEQGFTSNKYGSTVQTTQAAAIAYAYYLAEFNTMIDAFILHRHIDHQAEVNQGLALGLWTNKSGTIETPGSKKAAWNVYKYMDTSKATSVTKFALPIIKKGSWKLAVPGFNASRFK